MPDHHPLYSRPFVRKVLLRVASIIFIAVFGFSIGSQTNAQDQLPRLKYNNPGLIVDLGVGLWSWPMPMDYDGDGDLDLIVMCPDKPYSGTYFFENIEFDIVGPTTTRSGERVIDPTNPNNTVHVVDTMPVFAPAVRIADATKNVQVSYVDGDPILIAPGRLFGDFIEHQYEESISLPIETSTIHDSPRIRANQWKQADWDGDGRMDLLVGIGDWEDYGWDNAFDEQGEWTRGPLHGLVYFVRNVGTNEVPEYDDPQQLIAGDQPLDVYGMPSPNAADFDSDGDLDLICGEFLDGFTYFQNVGDREHPQLAEGVRLQHDGAAIAMDLQMIVPVAVDWNQDGHVDLVVGDEDGRVALVLHRGQVVDGIPQFEPPQYFQQVADDIKFGALVTPVSFDWDQDGDEDLICGNTAGYVGFIENLDGGNPPKWAAPRYLEADGQTLRIQAGDRGSIQGPCEAKWGYTTLSVADWDHDGLADLIVNSIWGKVEWYRNVGESGDPQLAAAEAIQVEWEGAPPKPAWLWWSPTGNELATQWRTTPVVVDWNDDRLNDLVMLDHEGYLVLFERTRTEEGLLLKPPVRCFYGANGSAFDSLHRVSDESFGLLRLNHREAGASGRRKLCVVDWDGDGRRDLLVNSRNISWMRQVDSESAEVGSVVFENRGEVTTHILAGHTTSPTTVDWNNDGQPDLLIGAEDGYFYYLER